MITEHARALLLKVWEGEAKHDQGRFDTLLEFFAKAVQLSPEGDIIGVVFEVGHLAVPVDVVPF